MQKPVDSVMSKILLDNKQDVLRIYLFSKLTEKKIRPHSTELDMLIELYIREGYSSKEESDSLFKWCSDNNLRKSRDSFNNFITKYVNYGVILKKGRHVREMNPEILAPTQNDNIALQQFVMNTNDLN